MKPTREALLPQGRNPRPLRHPYRIAMLVLPALASPDLGTSQPRLATETFTGRLEIAATVSNAMPTGVTVSRLGRLFINYPRWGDKVDFTVAEIKDGAPVPFPNAEVNKPMTGDSAAQARERFVSVQSVVVDPADRLWVLDTGRPEFKPPVAGGQKLVAIDLKTNRIVKTITFPADVALPTTYLNDVRFDLKRGKEGMAFITDSSSEGTNALIVVDLASGESFRRLASDPSTKAVPGFVAFVEGFALPLKPKTPSEAAFGGGADGIAISPDGKRLYYCPLSGRRLYSVSIDALVDRSRGDAEVARTIIDHGDKGASDGLESDAQGRVYISDYETGSLRRMRLDGTFELLVHDPRVLWPDTLSIAADGFLYFTANQLHRQPQFHHGKDLRSKPYPIFRMKVDGTRIGG